MHETSINRELHVLETAGDSREEFRLIIRDKGALTSLSSSIPVLILQFPSILLKRIIQIANMSCALLMPSFSAASTLVSAHLSKASKPVTFRALHTSQGLFLRSTFLNIRGVYAKRMGIRTRLVCGAHSDSVNESPLDRTCVVPVKAEISLETLESIDLR